MSENQNTLAMDADLAEAYRQLKTHVAGADFLDWLSNLQEQISYVLKVAENNVNVHRAQGALSVIDEINGRFSSAKEQLEEQSSPLKVVE